VREERKNKNIFVLLKKQHIFSMKEDIIKTQSGEHPDQIYKISGGNKYEEICM
jgi:hypothetical protein